MQTFEPWDNDEPVNYEDLLQRTLKLLHCINPGILSPAFRMALAKCLISSNVQEETIEKVLGVKLSTSRAMEKVIVERSYSLVSYNDEYDQSVKDAEVGLLIEAAFLRMGLVNFQSSLLVFNQIHISLENFSATPERDVAEDNKSEDTNENSSGPRISRGIKG